MTLTWLLQCHPIQNQECLGFSVLTTQIYKTAFHQIKSPSGLRATADSCLGQHTCVLIISETSRCETAASEAEPSYVMQSTWMKLLP